MSTTLSAPYLRLTDAAGARHAPPVFSSGQLAHAPRLDCSPGVRAGVAELLLIHRLRARARTGPGLSPLERVAEVMEVTSRHWFGDAAPGSLAGG